MKKEIKYCRTEYVKEYYQAIWSEKDYQDLLQWLSERQDNHNIATRYKALKELSFNDIVAIFNNEKNDVKYELSCDSGDRQCTYTEYASDFIREQMQSDAWSRYDFECYDCEEGIEIVDCKKNVKYLVNGELLNGDGYHEEGFDNLEDAKAYFRNSPSPIKRIYDENDKLVVLKTCDQVEIDLIGITE